MIVAVTGHRPKDCPEGEKIVRFKLRKKLERTPGIDRVIVGMASGVDLWAGDEALLLGIEVWAAKPWAGHKADKGDEQLYARVLEGASRVINVNERKTYPGPQAYHERNHWMVENGDVVLAYWNPEKESGGTYQCLKYAREEARKKIANIYFDPPF